MPTPAYCSLDAAYGNWNYDKPSKSMQLPNLNPNQSQIPSNSKNGYIGNMNIPQLTPISNSYKSKEEENLNALDGSETQGDIRSFCPNCNSCLKANDVLQQRIIEQNIYPRPQWVPQYPQAWVPYDPYNRYWANTTPVSSREDFGNGMGGMSMGGMNTSPETLLQIILFILVALFIIQLVECIYTKSSE